MPVIAVKPLVLKDVLLKIGTTDSYEKHVSAVKFTPASSTIHWQGLTPDAQAVDASPATWQVTLDYVQDWETANSLSQYLLEHAGESVSMEFTPVKGTGKKKFTSTVTIAAGDIGGSVNAFATTSVTMGCTKPVVATAA